MKFNVILADPAWGFSDGLKKMKRKTKRSAQSQYKTMSLEEIKALPVADLADPAGCVLALWVPSSMLHAGLEVMKAWGFNFKQTFVWVKLKKKHKSEADWNNSLRVGMGRLFRQSHEIVLLGTSGKSIYKMLQNRSQKSVMFDMNVVHSRKPDLLHDRFDLMFPNTNKVELYGRRTRQGWVVLGDQIDGVELQESIPALASFQENKEIENEQQV